MEYVLKCIHEDFIVKEIPISHNYCDKDEAYYTVFEVTKKGISTFTQTEYLADIFSLNTNDIQYCGLKDEEGITTQTVSIKKIIDEFEIHTLNKEFYKHNIKIDRLLGYSKERLQVGHLNGNWFDITIRNISESKLEILKSLFPKGKLTLPMVNYYDNQRFGIPGGIYNTHLIGKAIIEQKWEKAIHEFFLSSNSEVEKNKIKLYLQNGKDIADAFNTQLDPRKLTFFMNSYMSYLWNDKVSSFIIDLLGAEKCYRFSDNILNINFVKNNVDSMTPFNNSIQYQYYYSNNSNIVETSSKNRQLFLYVPVYLIAADMDELHNGKNKIKINFILKSGSYATMLLKQLMSGC